MSADAMSTGAGTMGKWRLAGLTLALTAGVVTSSAAQTAGTAWRPWRPLIAIGAGWTAADDLGRVTATQQAAAIGTTTPAPYPMFTVESTLGGAPRAELALGLPVTATLLFEVTGTMARPTLTSAISGDVEGAPDSEATESVDEYTVGARLVYDLARLTVGGRITPFVSAGGAYLRQLHDDQVLVESGQVWSGSVGARLWLRHARSGQRGAIGATVEGGWSLRSGGIHFVDGTRTMPTASVRLFAGF